MITPEQIQNAIARVDVNYVRGTATVICCLILTNGHVVVGQAHCAPGTEFDASKEAFYARLDAEAVLTSLLAFEARGPVFRTTH